MQQSLNFRNLCTDDEPIVKAWLLDYLHCHISSWLSTHGLAWSSDEVSAHIDTHNLVVRDWEELAKSVDGVSSLVKLAFNNEGLVGIVHASLRTDRYLLVPLGVIEWLYVSRPLRGQNVSIVLMNKALTWAQAQGAQAAEVFVTESNVAAMRCYQRSGFQRIDLRMVAELG